MSTDSGAPRDPRTTGGERPADACTAAIFGGGGSRGSWSVRLAPVGFALVSFEAFPDNIGQPLRLVNDPTMIQEFLRTE